MRRAGTLISELVLVDQQASIILDRGLENGEKGILLYLISDSCPQEVKLNPDWEDAGYQVHLLWCTILSDNPSAYVAQYKKYQAWILNQNSEPQFYWNSAVMIGLPPTEYISSPYASYLATEDSVRLIDEVRGSQVRASCNIIEPSAVIIEEAEGIHPDGAVETRLTKIAAEIARMRQCSDTNLSIEKFGTIASIEKSTLYQEMGRCQGERQMRKILKQFFPCLSPCMNLELYNVIIEEAIAGAKNPKLLLSALQKYEAVLRDMMEEEGTIRIADLYAIGRRTCKKFNSAPRNGESFCDILNTERLRLRFIEMKHELRHEKSKLRHSFRRYEFLDNEHKMLIESGSSDDFDYTPLRREIVKSIHALSSTPDDNELEQNVIDALDDCSYNLGIGIGDCLRSIGTERIQVPRLI